LVSVSPPVAAQAKVAVVDLGRLINESPQAKSVSEVISAEATRRRTQLQQQQQAFKVREEKLQKDAATMTPDQRSRAEKELRDSSRDLALKQQEAQDDFNARRQEETSRLERFLIEEVRTYAKAQSYDIVVAQGVLYNSPAYDITPQVLQVLATKPARIGGAPAPAAAPAATKPPAKP
jgi:outer membrane protein